MGPITFVAMRTAERFRRADILARRPARVDICGVDEVAAGLEIGVEDGLGRLLVRRPPERIATETEGGDSQPGTAQLAHQHGGLLWVLDSLITRGASRR